MTLKQFREFAEQNIENEIFQLHRDDYLNANLYSAIRNELNDFIITIIMATSAEEKPEGEHEQQLFPTLELRNDKKFMGVLQEMKDIFDNGCKNFGL